MLQIDSLHIAFGKHQILQLQDSLKLSQGEAALLVGETGSGKSTLLGALAGLVPNFTGGNLRGRGSLNSKQLFKSNRVLHPAEIGYVFQNPFEGFVQSTVRAEIVFSASQTQSSLVADDAWLMRLTNAVGISHLLERNLDSLSDGEAQRVAIAAALFLRPNLLLLDEPTSALDFVSATALRQLLQDLMREFNFGLIVAEHRYDIWLESVAQVWHLQNSQISQYSPTTFALESGLPLLTREVLKELQISSLKWRTADCRELLAAAKVPTPHSFPQKRGNSVAIQVRDLSIEISGKQLLKRVNCNIEAGSVSSVLGPSGAGKSTFLHALIGDFPEAAESVKVDQIDPTQLSAADLLGRIALVPQQPGNLFVSESVSGECELADRWRNLTPGTTLQIFTQFKAIQDLNLHPRDLSTGTQLWLAISIAIAAKPDVLILDEPTRGLDLQGKSRLVEFIQARQTDGLTTVLATHDLELAAGISNQLLYFEAGELQSAGEPAPAVHPQLAAHSAIFQLLSTSPYLSVEQLRRAREFS